MQNLKPRKILGLKPSIRSNWAVLEYRVIWNGACEEWVIYRNGTRTGKTRRKKQSAIDLAIIAIREDQSLTDAKATVVSIRDGVAKTEWHGSSNALLTDAPRN
jgi:hypothetical protein